MAVKALLKQLLVAQVSYSVDEFMTCHLEID